MASLSFSEAYSSEQMIDICRAAITVDGNLGSVYTINQTVRSRTKKNIPIQPKQTNKQTTEQIHI